MRVWFGNHRQTGHRHYTVERKRADETFVTRLGAIGESHLFLPRIDRNNFLAVRYVAIRRHPTYKRIEPVSRIKECLIVAQGARVRGRFCFW